MTEMLESLRQSREEARYRRIRSYLDGLYREIRDLPIGTERTLLNECHRAYSELLEHTFGAHTV